MNKIFVDFDGVILDSIAVICSIMSKRDNAFYDPSKVLKWNMQDVIPSSTSESITELFESDLFWEVADDYLMDGIKEFIEKYKDRIIVCSIGGIKNQVGKLTFIKKHFGDIDCIPIVTDMNVHPKNIDKTYVNMGEGDIYFEDSYSNLQSSNAEHKVLFNNYENWNAEWSVDEDKVDVCSLGYYRRVCNWSEIQGILDKIMVNK